MVSAPSFWARLGLGLGGWAGDSAEELALMQRRVALYLGGVAFLWVSITVTAYCAALAFMPELLRATGARWVGPLHIAATVCFVIAWLVVKRGRLSLAALARVEAVVTLAQSLVMSSLLSGTDLRFRPDMSMAMGLSCSLIGRAAVIPSSARRTALLGSATALPLALATLAAYARTNTPGLLRAGIVTSQIGMWMVFIVFLSTTISRVIYGLSQQVEEAVRLGQYTLEGKIGEGGMGVVYLARHALLRRPTAIKLLLPGKDNQRSIERFEREVQITSGLQHPNTVAIYDYGRTPDGVFYYAMEYLDGIDLEILVRRTGPLVEGRVVAIIAQVARALGEAHQLELIHRDIKPSNIVLCDHGNIPDFAKVLDFGLVKELNQGQATLSNVDAIVGTPLYLSPEAILTPATIDARADIYALGAVAYWLLTGAPVFEGSSFTEVCAHHLHSEVVPPSVRADKAVNADLERLVLACLSKKREERPLDTAALLERLATCQVTPWRTAEARAWWDEQGRALRAELEAARSSSQLGNTIAVDLGSRLTLQATRATHASSELMRKPP